MNHALTAQAGGARRGVDMSRNPQISRQSRVPSKKQYEAARLFAEGYTHVKVAEILKIGERTLYEWMKREDLRQFRDRLYRQRVAAGMPRAYGVLEKQLGSENEWIQQNAANSLLRAGESVTDQGPQTILVQFGSMPAPGMPGLPEDSGSTIGATGTAQT